MTAAPFDEVNKNGPTATCRVSQSSRISEVFCERTLNHFAMVLQECTTDHGRSPCDKQQECGSIGAVIAKSVVSEVYAFVQSFTDTHR